MNTPVNEVSDETLTQWESGANRGHSRSAPVLRPLSPALRWLAVQEAHTRMAVSPGWNFSGAVDQAVADLKRGQTPCLDLAAKLMADDPTGEKAAMAARHGRSWSTDR